MNNFEFFSIFTNYACNYNCSYCCLKYPTQDKVLLKKEKPISAREFLYLNKIKVKLPDLILHIHGGEPLLYPELDYLLYNLDFNQILIVSNFSIPITNCITNLHKLKGKVKFIGSYHPENADNKIFIDNSKILKKENMLERIVGVDGYITEDIKAMFWENDFEIVIYPYKGIKNNVIFPADMREHARGWVTNEPGKTVLCKSTKFLIDPLGDIWNCSTHMYRNNKKYCFGNIRDNFNMQATYHKCDEYRYCNPCQGDYHQYRELV